MTDHSTAAYCRGCASTMGKGLTVAEMMFRSGESFTYFHCERCDSFSRVGTPENLSQYYDADRYYSFDHQKQPMSETAGLRRMLMMRRDAGELFRRLPDRLLCFWKPNPALADLRRYLACVQKPSFQTRVLDVGCGNGKLIQRMAHIGGGHSTHTKNKQLSLPVPQLFPFVTCHPP